MKRKTCAGAQRSGSMESRVSGGTGAKLPYPPANSAHSASKPLTPGFGGVLGVHSSTSCHRASTGTGWSICSAAPCRQPKHPLPNTANAERQKVISRAECSKLKPLNPIFKPATAANGSLQALHRAW